MEKQALETNKTKRNEYIDFLRGIAAIGIIAIHTSFWAGQSYIPEIFYNLTLLLDVPFFFYLSGWASSFRKANITKTFKSLVNIWLKWIYFITLLALFCKLSEFTPYHISGVYSLNELINNYMFNVSFAGVGVVGGSIWFMQYYFVILVVNTIVIMAIERHDNSIELKKTYMWMLLAGFVWVYYGRYALGLDISIFLFYSFFWMLGLNKIGKTNRLVDLVFMCSFMIVMFVISSRIHGMPLHDIQNAKFPPSLKYGFASMLVIFVAKFFDGKVSKCNHFICHIGKNAIWYYFAQGIGSSFNFFVVNHISINYWPIKWFITLIINLVVTIVIAECFAFTYKTFETLIKENKNRLIKMNS